MADQNAQKNAQKVQTPAGYVGPLYGPVSFEKPEQASIYTNRNGGKSTMAILAKVPILPHGLLVEAAIWLRQKNTDDGTELECGAAIPRGMKAYGETDEARDVAKDEFCAHIETSALAWSGYENAYNSAFARLTGTKVKTAFESKRPKLVLPNGERKEPTDGKTDGKTA